MEIPLEGQDHDDDAVGHHTVYKWEKTTAAWAETSENVQITLEEHLGEPFRQVVGFTQE